MTTRTLLLSALVSLTLCYVASAKQVRRDEIKPACIACGSSVCERECLSYFIAGVPFVRITAPQGALWRWLDGIYPRPEFVTWEAK